MRRCLLALVFLPCASGGAQASGLGPDDFISPATDIGFVRLDGGCYLMGSDSQKGFDFERPVHEVCVHPFLIGRTEVTPKQWMAIMDENPSKFIGPNRPVDRVSFLDAEFFIRKLNEVEGTTLYRLPTEAEWEYAARAGTTTEYYWGDEMDDDYAWYYGTSRFKTHPVGTKKPNRFGLYDMLGNVWEWVSDWFDIDYYRVSPKDNPKGPAAGKFRTRRGGSSANLVTHVRSATRYRGPPDKRHHILGLRVARSMPPERL